MESNPQKAFKFLKEFKEEIKQKNRFFINEKFLEPIREFTVGLDNLITYSPKHIFYRARVYNEEDKIKKYHYPKNDQFQGYDGEGSFVNLQQPAKEGRINPAFIPYLYVSTSKQGAIIEVRPYADTLVSVAKIRVNKPLKIVDFSRAGAMSTGEDGDFKATLYVYINGEFSSPYYGDRDYLVTQIISEYVKKLGFDGVAYCSAYSRKVVVRSKPYKNVAVFNYDKCSPIESKLYMINKIVPEFSEVKP